MACIPVRPKHYRAIVLEALALFPNATVWVDKRRCDDFSEAGPLTQQGIARLRDFEIRTESIPILGFHDHPREMWIDGKFRELAERLQSRGDLKIEPPVMSTIRYKTPNRFAAVSLGIAALLMAVAALFGWSRSHPRPAIYAGISMVLSVLAAVMVWRGTKPAQDGPDA